MPHLVDFDILCRETSGELIGVASEHASRRSGYDIRTVQELLGHKDVKTTMIYTNVLNRGGNDVKSPVDDLLRRTVGVLLRSHILPDPSCPRRYNDMYGKGLFRSGHWSVIPQFSGVGVMKKPYKRC